MFLGSGRTDETSSKKENENPIATRIVTSLDTLKKNLNFLPILNKMKRIVRGGRGKRFGKFDQRVNSV